jgi:hypothetical protein
MPSSDCVSPISHGRKLVAAASIVSAGVVTYWTAVRDSFISDDFTMLPSVRILMEHPAQILSWPSEVFRVVSYIYFAICVQAFGLSPEPFYWTGIVLHILVSLLVGKLVLTLTGNFRAAWAAALFFVVYERHQEAVMWISAINDTIVSLFCVLFLLFWERSLAEESRWRIGLALGTLAIAMFSKESWVAVVPLAILLVILQRWPWRRLVRRSMPLLVMIAAYAVLWLSNAQRNFFITDGHYTLSSHALIVYFNTFLRLVSQAAILVIPFLVFRNVGDLSRLFRNRMLQFFLVMVALSIIPYSFLTYLDHIPSRNTYLPSVGVAGVAGILLASLLERAGKVRRTAGVVLFGALLAANSLYIWIKKEPQFRERAAPTRELLAILNQEPPADASETIYVCGFPLHVWIGQTAVEGFTKWTPERVVFLEECKDSSAGQMLQWNADGETYTRVSATVSSSK